MAQYRGVFYCNPTIGSVHEDKVEFTAESDGDLPRAIAGVMRRQKWDGCSNLVELDEHSAEVRRFDLSWDEIGKRVISGVWAEAPS